MNEIHQHRAVRGDAEQAVVEPAYKAECQNTANCNPQGEAFTAGGTEIRDSAFILADEHGLYNKQIVIQRDDCVYKRYKHKHVDCHASLIDGSREDKEFREEAVG